MSADSKIDDEYVVIENLNCPSEDIQPNVTHKAMIIDHVNAISGHVGEITSHGLSLISHATTSLVTTISQEGVAKVRETAIFLSEINTKVGELGQELHKKFCQLGHNMLADGLEQLKRWDDETETDR